MSFQREKKDASCALIAALLAVGTPAAHADVTATAPDSFAVKHTALVPLDAKAAYERLVHIEQWWDAGHTYGGRADALKLAATPGGCWCEQLADGGFVEHMRVIYAQPGKVLRLDGGLGPLQGVGARGVMTYTLKPEGAGTKVTMTYVVIGAAGSLDKLAVPVDGVLAQAMQRFGNVGAVER
jgi:uncharacterized protein YndB with AHSA1/START domain